MGIAFNTMYLASLIHKLQNGFRYEPSAADTSSLPQEETTALPSDDPTVVVPPQSCSEEDPEHYHTRVNEAKVNGLVYITVAWAYLIAFVWMFKKANHDAENLPENDEFRRSRASRRLSKILLVCFMMIFTSPVVLIYKGFIYLSVDANDPLLGCDEINT